MPPCTMRIDKVMRDPIVNHHVKDRRAIDSHAGCRLAVGHSSEGSPPCQERRAGVDGSDLGSADPDGFRPRCRKMDTLPAPLSAMASPGSSCSDVVTRKEERANGPPFVR